MPVGPTLILDKSTLQSLSIEEARWLGHHFHVNLIEPLYIEIAGASTAPDRKNPTADIVSLAKKLLEIVPTLMPNARSNHLQLGNLLGLEFELDGRIVLEDVQRLRLPGGRVVNFQDEPPHFEALRRWARGDLNDREQHGARLLREFIAAVDLNRIREVFRTIPGLRIQNLEEALALVDRVAASMAPFRALDQVIKDLHIPAQYRNKIVRRWKANGRPPVKIFAPYSYFVWRVARLFDIGIGSKLISTKESKSYIDAMYLYYLPFCEVFASGDKFHRQTVPLFLRPDQRFYWGPTLKADAAKLRAHYESLPDEIRRTGSMNYARLPPKDDRFLVAEIFDELRPGWREW
jgi:hypothetical protein